MKLFLLMASFKHRLELGWSWLRRGVVPAQDGAGPLLQRDYWAAIRAPRVGPRELMAEVKQHFERFPPEALVCFQRRAAEARALSLGDELDIRIRMAGECAVRVVHEDANSITLATLEGHPEAGRITFGSYRNQAGDLLFHIRSRARSATRTKYIGFLAMGDAMQTSTWIDFINAVAAYAGEGVAGEIQVATQEIADEPPEAVTSPTFLARGE
jgi:hypothetical protein